MVWNTIYGGCGSVWAAVVFQLAKELLIRCLFGTLIGDMVAFLEVSFDEGAEDNFRYEGRIKTFLNMHYMIYRCILL